MPCKSAALELLERALPIGGSKPIARCTASAIFTRFDSRLPGNTAAGDADITSVSDHRLPVRAVRTQDDLHALAAQLHLVSEHLAQPLVVQQRCHRRQLAEGSRLRLH